MHAQKSREPDCSPPPFDTSPCTPPPQYISPQPLTPKPSRFVSPPRTPLPKLFTNLTPRASAAGNHWDEGGLAPGVASISRPESACSNYSSSSDSSLDSLTTFTTAGGSCASPNTEASFFAEETDADADADSAHLKPGDATRASSAKSSKTRVRKTKWTDEMDGHLWRTYIIYQQDPKITPFYVLPGQVPPLGVCCKVARETKRSWKEAKMGDGWRGAPSTPRPKRKHRVRETSETVASSGNRGDVLRKASPYSWPASEASTRRRLRELCRGSYGPSVNPHREYRQQRRQAATTPRLLPPRSSNVSPSPLNSAASERIGSRDAFLFSTRSIALSLTTSTASTMSPNGLLAAIAAGYDVKAGTAVGFGSAGFDFGENLDRSSVSGRESRQGGVPAEDVMSGTPTRSSSVSSSGLLPPLELKSSSSSYGTWPRRLKRQEALQDLASESFVLPPSRRARRGTLGDLFGNPAPSASSSSSVTPAPAAASAAATTATITRSRGFTIGASTFSSRRRYRPVAPLLTVTGPVSYDADESLSPLAARQPPPTTTAATISSAADDAPKRLGSPFERKEWREEEEDADEPVDNDDEPNVGMGNGRPVKRPRE